MMNELIDVVRSEFERMADDGPLAAEVARSKAQLKAGLLMSLESSSARAEQMARQLLTHKRLLTTEELIASVDTVTSEDIRAVARGLRKSAVSVAVVGAGQKSREFAARAGERLAL